jgi:tetratricopeptide (TPR) repeat protein
MRPRLSRIFPLALSGLLIIPSTLFAQDTLFQPREERTPEAIRALQHESSEWKLIEPHLPNPATATPAQLELTADVLRARRFPEDALDLYMDALRRGGDPAKLMNKMGITELELRRIAVARAYFQQVLKITRKDAQAWNNLGAVEYLDGRYGKAISDYNHALKIDRNSATYHSNLGTAYFEERNFQRALHEYDVALTLDPDLMSHHTAAGISARMLSPADHAHYCFEMAVLFAHRGDDVQVIHYLTMASEAGFDIEHELAGDEKLAVYRKDPRVLTIERNARALRSGRVMAADVPGGALPPLPGEWHD